MDGGFHHPFPASKHTIERDVVAQMDFAPVINQPPVLMDERIFRPAPMGLRGAIVKLRFNERFSYDAAQNILFINFEGLEVKRLDDATRSARRWKPNCAMRGRSRTQWSTTTIFRSGRK